MFKRPQYIAFALVLVLVLVLLNLPKGAATQLKLAVGGLFLPLFGAGNTAKTATEKADDAITPRKVLIQELRKLEKENQKLQLRNLQSEAIKRENERLRNLVQWRDQQPWQMLLSRVIGRDPANWFKMIHIDVGGRNQVTEAMPVLTTEGLVGRVLQVGYTRSQVVMLGDPNCRVHVEVLSEDSTTVVDSGILGPNSDTLADPQIVSLTYLSGTGRLERGQQVVTSGLGGVFPKGIPVGSIIYNWAADDGLRGEAQVSLHANAATIEEVWVIKP